MASWKVGLGIFLLLSLLLAGLFLLRPPETQLDKAIALIKASKDAAALPILEEIARKQPDNEQVFPWLAQGYLRTDRIAEGRIALDTTLRLRLPCALTTPVTLAYADYYCSKNDFAEAERLFASAQGSEPDRNLLAGKAKMFQDWSKQDVSENKLQEAIQHLQSAYQILPDDNPAHSAIPHQICDFYRQLAAVAEVDSKNDSKAIQLLETGLSVADEPATRMALGAIYSRRGNIARAIESYRAVSLGDPNNLEARHHLIDLCLEHGDNAGAQESLVELTDKERSVENFELLASVSLKLGNYAGAVRALEDANLLRPKDLPLLLRLHQALLDWSASLLKQGKSDESSSVKGHADRVSEMIADIQKAEDKLKASTVRPAGTAPVGPGAPPVCLTSSRIWLARGSLTPEGEIQLKNISGQAVVDLSLTIVFFDNTARRKNGAVTVSAASQSHPMLPQSSRSIYFSCPNIVRAEHHLAVLIIWQGRLLKELPVVKER